MYFYCCILGRQKYAKSSAKSNYTVVSIKMHTLSGDWFCVIIDAASFAFEGC